MTRVGSQRHRGKKTRTHTHTKQKQTKTKNNAKKKQKPPNVSVSMTVPHLPSSTMQYIIFEKKTLNIFKDIDKNILQVMVFFIINILGNFYNMFGSKGTIFSYYIYAELAGVPSVARDEKLRKQIFEIPWRDKGWIG